MRLLRVFALFAAMAGCGSDGRDMPSAMQPGGGNTQPPGTGQQGGTPPPKGDDTIVDVLAPCDQALDIADDDPIKAAASVGICTQAQGSSQWGLVDARYVLFDGSEAPTLQRFAKGHGLLKSFGKKARPKEGEALLALSSGTARAEKQSGYASPSGYDKGYGSGNLPDGIDLDSPACPGVQSGLVYDDIALELVLVAPPQARSLAFDFNFYTYEWPDYVCSEFNDYFAAILATGSRIVAGSQNISFDQLGNPVSINNAFVRACSCSGGPPCLAPPEEPYKSFECKLGADFLETTGFENHAATGWLTTQSPVEPGATVTLRWGIYDAGDHVLDSTVLIDNFRWQKSSTKKPETKAFDPN